MLVFFTACISREQAGESEEDSDTTMDSATDDGAFVGDLPFLEEHCPKFTDTLDCLVANHDNPPGGWSCRDPVSGAVVHCYCHWREFIEVTDVSTCEGQRIVEGCVPGFVQPAGEVTCDLQVEVSDRCDYVLLSEDDPENPNWVALGWRVCRPADSPTGDATKICTLEGDESLRCNDCTIQLVNEICE